MENNVVNKKRKLNLVILTGLLVLVLAAGAVAAYSYFRKPAESVSEETPEDPSVLLREQLADESVTEVTIDGEVIIDESLIVKGTKTISGGSITVAEGTELPDGILCLEDGAKVTFLSGLIDGKLTANGIYVPEGAYLSIEGGEICYANEWCVYNDGEVEMSDGTIYYGLANNVYTAGKFDMSGGTISDAGKNNIYQAKGSEIRMTGGTLDTAGVTNLYAEEDTVLTLSGEKTKIRNAIKYGIYSDGKITIEYVNMSKNLANNIVVGYKGSLALHDAFISSSSGSGILNKGTMVMYDGEIGSNNLSGVTNLGDLTVYGGTITFNTERAITNKIGGKLKVTGTDAVLSGSTYGLYNEEGAEATLEGIVLQDNGTSNIRNYGTVYVSNSELLNCGSNSVSNFRNGHIILKNVVIDKTVKNHAIYNDRGKVEFTNLTVKSPASRAIQNKGGIVEGKNITISGTSGAAVGNNIPNDSSKGSMVIDGMVTTNVNSNNVYCENGTVKISNATLAVSPKNSVRVVDGTVSISDSKILGTTKPTDSASCGVYASGGTTTLTNVVVQNVEESPAINNRGGDVFLYDVTIENSGKTAIYNRPEATTLAVGDIYGQRVKIINSATANVNNDAEGTTITLVDSTLGVTEATNAIVTKGTVTLENTVIEGTQAKSQRHCLQIMKGATGIIKGTSVVTGAYGKGVYNEGTLYMYGGTIENNQASAGAGLTNDGVAVVSDSIIRNNKTLSASGGGILNNAGAKLTLTNVEVSGNTSKTIGGGIALVADSTCTMYSGTIKNNTASCSTTSAAGGGGITISGGANFYFLGGTFTGNKLGTSKGVGSAIRMASAKSVMHMGGNATVASDNDVYITAGATIVMDSALTTDKAIPLMLSQYVPGAIVLEEAKEGQGYVAASNEKFDLKSPWYINDLGELEDETAVEVAKIYDPTNVAAKEDGYVYYKYLQKAIDAVEDGETATIEMIADAEVTGMVTVDGGKKITITDDGTARYIKRSASYTSGRLICITGNATLTLTSTGDDTNPKLYLDGQSVEASSGQFIIIGTGTSDENKNNQLIINAGVVLQNSKSTSTFGGAIAVYAGSMTMNGGQIINNASGSGAGAINVGVADTKFTMNGGTISGNTTASTKASTSENGGAINVVKGALFEMNGGTISDNTADDYGGAVSVTGAMVMTGGSISGNKTNNYRGGGIAVTSNGSFVMTGGEINGNTAKTTGGGVSLQNNALMSMTGGTISGNTGISGGDGVEFHYNNNVLALGGNAYVDDVFYYAAEGAVIRVMDDFVAQAGSEIGITVKTPELGYRVLAELEEGYTDEEKAFFKVNSTTYAVDNEGELKYAGTPVAMIGEQVYFSLQDAVDAAPTKKTEATVEEGGTVEATTIKIVADIAIESLVTIDGGRNIILIDDGAAHSIYRSESYVSDRMICAANGSSLTLSTTSYSDETPLLYFDGKDVSAKNSQILIVGSSSSEDTIGSSLTINPGVVVQKAKASSGTGAALAVYTGTCTMNGGKIINNENTSGAGGAINVAGGSTFTMNNGEISGNKTSASEKNGGAINLGGTMIVNGGTISNNSSTYYGGAVYLSSASSRFTLNSGTISGNNAEQYGGAVFVVGKALMEMNGGTLSGNTTNKYRGGAISLAKNGNFTMTDGTISGNTAQTQGGAINVQAGSTVTMTGGEIKGNTGKSGGNGINLHTTTSYLALGKDAYVDDVYFYDGTGATITLNADFVTEREANKLLGITVRKAAVNYRILVNGTYTAAQLGCFNVTNSGYTLGTTGCLVAE